MSEKKCNYVKEVTKGIIKENPVLCLVLGTCPTLAVTTAASNAIGMGLAATLVLIGSNAVISALRKLIPDKVRIPAYITVIATFVTIVQMLVKAFVPSIDESLGIFLPLIVVNCIILGRAEMYASKNSVIPSMLDGLGMGIGFTVTLLLMGSIREILGNGTWFGHTLIPEFGILIFILPPGGFFVFGMLIALASKISGKNPPKATGCANCPLKGKCSAAVSKGEKCENTTEVQTSALALEGGESL
ncbi:MAG: electron transport complex subunit E [Ruminococcus sp.]|nr:electron transport complex subunit E [Ruminococcus sp.]